MSRVSPVIAAAVLSQFVILSPLAAQQNNQGPQQPGILADAKSSPSIPVHDPSDDQQSKRILGIIPNFRTSPSLHPYAPISAREKFHVAAQDAFDRGTVALAAVFAGEGQLSNSNPSFGQGAAGYGRYLATSYADFAIGDYMTEGIFPSLLHQDPRYFRRGEGRAVSRLSYAVGQIIITHNDSGKTAPNYSEVVGNSVAVGISNLYYQDSRDAKDAGVKLVSQLSVDAASNVLKEFWPDLQRKFHRH